jgi:phytoene desaturase
MKIAVIGSGISALAVSIRLKKKGHNITVFEKNNVVGGKISEFMQAGFRFDTGPSISTLPHLIDELFELHKLNPRNYFNYTKLKIIGKFFYEDSTIITAYYNRQKFNQEITSKLGIPKNYLEKYFNELKEIDKMTGLSFLSKPIHLLRSHFNISTIKFLLKYKLLRIFSSIHKVNKEKLKDDKLVQLFDRVATYNGSNPYQASAIMRSISYLEFGYGSYRIHGGFISVKNALELLAKQVGVNFEMNELVSSIKTSNNKIKGLVSNDRYYDFDMIVSNMDINNHYLKVANNKSKIKKALKNELSSSMVVFYWGMNQTFDMLDTHNTFFSDNYKKEFDHIFTKKTLYEDPTIYINISSKEEKNDAPSGSENWFVMINSPHDNGQDWDIEIDALRNNVINKINRILKVDITESIILEKTMTPKDLEKNTLTYKGALYGTSSNSNYAAFLRHRNKSKDTEGLYFCGGTVHPGGGTPLCLMSAKITSELIN